MQGLWKDKRKHVLRDKIKPLYKHLYKDENSIDVLEYKTRTDIIFNSEKDCFITYRNVMKQPMSNEKVITRAFDREKIFAYGKPLNVNFWNEFGFWSTKARKYAQKRAHKADRKNVRNYISNGDWDSTIKTHALSKSIAWEIY